MIARHLAMLLCVLLGSDALAAGEPAAAPATTGPHGIRLINPSLYVAQPPAGTPTPQREPDIDQAKLLAGGYPLKVVLEAGQNLFNNPFEVANGHGEGRNGPRSLQRKTWNPRGVTDDQDAWPFLRVNGIDSQSCFECHNTIGKENPPDAATAAYVRRPGAQGGPAGAASTAFINDLFPEYLGQPNSVLTKFARNPPHVFGTGYTQRLATEMSTELAARAGLARALAKRSPGKPVAIPLQSKGVDFGVFSASCTSAGECTDDLSKVVGVQGDLIIRPFQWGGISSTVRHFARDALDFHFSVQAVEKVGRQDCDLDGQIDEVTVGNVSALASYVTMFRPPVQEIAPGKEASVQRGRALLDKIGCTDCHRASMTIVNPTLTIMTPAEVPPGTPCPAEVSSLINPVAEDAHLGLAEIQAYLDAAEAKAPVAKLSEDASPEAAYAALEPHLHTDGVVALASKNYQIDLSLSGVAMGNAPAYVWPRLPAGPDRRVEVPLFSDLKLHYMGKRLSDDYPQPVDSPGYAAQPGYYVTRVLWGINDTDPYLHDGRARTLEDAIRLHGAEGSEAAPAAAKFAALSPTDQQALLDFLQSLRLPVAKGVTQPEYVSR
ncbi:MAG: hypothetical protein H4O13_07430 [Xanthomonadales bacterium]|nr:hypothetical protein [Xanthomonadales bacterium]